MIIDKHDQTMEELVESLFNAMNNRDFDRFEEITGEEVCFDFPGAGRMEGKRRTLLLLKTILRKYPKLHFSLSEVICTGERACAVWTNEGESADGTPYSNSGMTLIHFRDGKITFLSDYFKDTSFVR